MDILEISNDIEKKNITRYILEALPDWFGIPESREEYIEDSAAKIFFCAYIDDKPVVTILNLTDDFIQIPELMLIHLDDSKSPFIVFIGKVTHNLCQQGKQQAQHGRRPSQAPAIMSQSHCNHHARQRYGQSAQPQGFNPYFQLFHRFLLGFLVWNCAEELSSASKQRIIASRITLASGPSCLRMRKMVLK